MTTCELVGWVAAALTLAAFSMRSMRSLRYTAVASNLAFIAYGLLSHLFPVLALHSILLPCNLIRLWLLKRSACGKSVENFGPSSDRAHHILPHAIFVRFDRPSVRVDPTNSAGTPPNWLDEAGILPRPRPAHPFGWGLRRIFQAAESRPIFASADRDYASSTSLTLEERT